MNEKEIIDFFRSCDLSTKEPTEEFIKLKEEYDKIIVPRQQTFLKLGFCEVIKSQGQAELKESVIREENKFYDKAFFAGELRSCFFTEKLPKRLNELSNGSVGYPFYYCTELTAIPEELCKIISMNALRFAELDRYTEELFISYFYNFVCGINARTKFKAGYVLQSVFGNPEIGYCTINKNIFLAFHKTGKYMYFKFVKFTNMED